MGIEGKTVKSVDDSAVNYKTITFTDGTILELETVYMGHDLYGIETKLTSENTARLKE